MNKVNSNRKWLQISLLIFIVLALVIPDSREWLLSLVEKNNFVAMKEYIQSFGIWGPIFSMLLMTINTMIIPLPTFIITVANAMLYGWLWGAIISWTGAMIGAAITFGIAKIYGRPVVEKLVGKRSLDMMDGFFEKYGKHTILLLRLVPVMSFGIVSYAAGLTAMRFSTYYWATGIGQAPATLVYSYIAYSIADEILAGQGAVSVPVLFWIVIALLVMGVIAWAGKEFIMRGDKKS